MLLPVKESSIFIFVRFFVLKRPNLRTRCYISTMKYLLFIVLLLSSVASYAQTKELATLDGHFSIVLPDTFSDPELSSQTIPSDAGDLLLKMYTTSSQDNQVFVISYNDYPDSLVVASNIPKMLDAVRDGALKNMNAKMEKQMDLTFSKSPARTVNFISTIEGVISYGRIDIMLVAPRLYQIIYITANKKQRSSKEIKNVFLSFKLITEEAED